MGITAELVKLISGGFIMGCGTCLAYTAPLLLPYIGGTRVGWRAGLRIGGMFALGRVLAVAILGALATVAFSFINHFFPPHRSGYLYLLAAVLIVVLGVLIVMGKPFRPFASKIKKQGRFDGDTPIFFLGFLLGITPCAPLIAVLTYIACVAKNVALGVLYALAFGISASVPLLALSAGMGVVPEKLFPTAKLRRTFQIICGAVLILFGVYIIFSVCWSVDWSIQ